MDLITSRSTYECCFVSDQFKADFSTTFSCFINIFRSGGTIGFANSASNWREFFLTVGYSYKVVKRLLGKLQSVYRESFGYSIHLDFTFKNWKDIDSKTEYYFIEKSARPRLKKY